MQRERGGVAAGPQPDYAAGLSVRKQPPHAKANREKDLSLCSPPAHPYGMADEPNRSVILWRGKELLFIRGRFESESEK